MQDKHVQSEATARARGELPPPPPSTAARERTMFSHCVFELEDRVLGCIDRELHARG